MNWNRTVSAWWLLQGLDLVVLLCTSQSTLYGVGESQLGDCIYNNYTMYMTFTDILHVPFASHSQAINMDAEATECDLTWAGWMQVLASCTSMAYPIIIPMNYGCVHDTYHKE